MTGREPQAPADVPQCVPDVAPDVVPDVVPDVAPPSRRAAREMRVRRRRRARISTTLVLAGGVVASWVGWTAAQTLAGTDHARRTEGFALSAAEVGPVPTSAAPLPVVDARPPEQADREDRAASAASSGQPFVDLGEPDSPTAPRDRPPTGPDDDVAPAPAAGAPRTDGPATGTPPAGPRGRHPYALAQTAPGAAAAASERPAATTGAPAAPPVPPPTSTPTTAPTTPPPGAGVRPPEPLLSALGADRLLVASVGVYARVVPGTVTGDAMALPGTTNRIAWHPRSAPPAASSGTTLVAGRLSGALVALRAVAPHDDVVVTDKDRVATRWRVVSLGRPGERLPADALATGGPRRLVLVACDDPVLRVAPGARSTGTVVVAVPAT